MNATQIDQSARELANRSDPSTGLRQRPIVERKRGASRAPLFRPWRSPRSLPGETATVDSALLFADESRSTLEQHIVAVALTPFAGPIVATKVDVAAVVVGANVRVRVVTVGSPHVVLTRIARLAFAVGVAVTRETRAFSVDT